MRLSIKQIVFVAILLVSVFYAGERIIYKSFHDSKISITFEAASTGPFQIFYDVGNGYNEKNSISIFHHDTFEKPIEFTIRSRKFFHFRIDPVYSPKPVVISEIRFLHQQQERVWKEEGLANRFAAMNDIEDWGVVEGNLSFRTAGKDPFFGYIENLEQEINFEHNTSKIAWIVILLLFFNILIYVLLFRGVILYKKYSVLFLSERRGNFYKPEKLFLIIAMFWGILTVFITPPFQVPDEPHHFFRIYHLSCGNLSTPSTNDVIGDSLPASLQLLAQRFNHIQFHPEEKENVGEIVESFNIPLNVDNKRFFSFRGASHYLPVPYLPQAISMLIPRLLHLPPLYLFYFARLGNLLMWILLVYLAIRLIPFHKRVLCCIAFLPMSLFQAASLSTDAPTIGLAYLLVAIIFRIAFLNEKQFLHRNFILIILLSGLLAMSKSAYFLIPLLIILIPRQRYSSISKQLQFIILVVFMIGMGAYAGSLYVNYIYRDVDLSQGMYHALPDFPSNVKPIEQLNFILSDILRYIKIFAQTIFDTRNHIYHSMIGNLGWLDAPVSKSFVYAASILILIIAVFDNTPKLLISAWERVYVFAIIMGTIGLIGTLLYLSWTCVGCFTIQGFQGRYFLPIVPLITSLFYVPSFKIPDVVKNLLVLIFVILSFIVMNYTLITRFYVVIKVGV